MEVLRRVLLASVMLAAGTSPVLATEVKADSEPYSWSGFDFGVQGGYGGSVEHDNLGVADFEIPTSFFPTGKTVGDIAAQRAIGGAHIGYDQQFGSLVFGIRGEIDATELKGANSDITKFNLNGGTNCQLGCNEYVTSAAFSDSRQAFLLGRSGYDFDRILVFAEGGVAVGNESVTVLATQAEEGGLGGPILTGAWYGTGTHTVVGGAVGLGADYALTSRWRLGAEWRFVDFAGASNQADLVFSHNIYDHTVGYRAGFLENLGLLDASYRF
jgi:outer membrane immunogenic protein